MPSPSNTPTSRTRTVGTESTSMANSPTASDSEPRAVVKVSVSPCPAFSELAPRVNPPTSNRYAAPASLPRSSLPKSPTIATSGSMAQSQPKSGSQTRSPPRHFGKAAAKFGDEVQTLLFERAAGSPGVLSPMTRTVLVQASAFDAKTQIDPRAAEQWLDRWDVA